MRNQHLWSSGSFFARYAGRAAAVPVPADVLRMERQRRKSSQSLAERDFGRSLLQPYGYWLPPPRSQLYLYPNCTVVVRVVSIVSVQKPVGVRLSLALSQSYSCKNPWVYGYRSHYLNHIRTIYRKCTVTACVIPIVFV